MALTDPLTAAALTLLNGHGHGHHHHHKAVPTPTPTQTEFHIGSFHHYISGAQIGDGLGVIIVIVVICCIVAMVRGGR